jgi:hypothetical protein
MFQIGPSSYYSLTLTMSTRTNATISPERAAGDPNPIAVTVPRRSSRANKKRRQEEADTPDGTGTGTGTGPAAKISRLASAEKETPEQEGDATPVAPLTTEEIMNLLKGLWSDDKCVIKRALKKIADIGCNVATANENEVNIRMLGGHTTVFHVLQKHVGCFEIQEQGMRALGNLSLLLPTKKLLGDIGCVEVILATMKKYPDCERLQCFGCYVIGRLVFSMKCNAERVEKSAGGIAVVIAAMKAYPNKKELQKFGCIALSNMSVWEEYRPLIAEAGGLSAISSVIEKYRDHPKLHEDAFKALRKLVVL